MVSVVYSCDTCFLQSSSVFHSSCTLFLGNLQKPHFTDGYDLVLHVCGISVTLMAISALKSLVKSRMSVTLHTAATVLTNESLDQQKGARLVVTSCEYCSCLFAHLDKRATDTVVTSGDVLLSHFDPLEVHFVPSDMLPPCGQMWY